MSSLSGAVQLYDAVLHNSCGDVGCKAPAPYAQLAFFDDHTTGTDMVLLKSVRI